MRDIVTIVKSMDIEHMNANHRLNLTGHTKGNKMHQRKVTPTIGIITHGIVVIIVESMSHSRKFHKNTFQRKLQEMVEWKHSLF